MVQKRRQRRVDRAHALISGQRHEVPVIVHGAADELLGGVHAGAGEAEELVVAGETLRDPQALGEAAVLQVKAIERRRAQPANVPGMEELVGAGANRGVVLGGVGEHVGAGSDHRAGQVLEAPVGTRVGGADERVVLERERGEYLVVIRRDRVHVVHEAVHARIETLGAVEEHVMEGRPLHLARDQLERSEHNRGVEQDLIARVLPRALPELARPRGMVQEPAVRQLVGNGHHAPGGRHAEIARPGEDTGAVTEDPARLAELPRRAVRRVLDQDRAGRLLHTVGLPAVAPDDELRAGVDGRRADVEDVASETHERVVAGHPRRRLESNGAAGRGVEHRDRDLELVPGRHDADAIIDGLGLTAHAATARSRRRTQNGAAAQRRSRP